MGNNMINKLTNLLDDLIEKKNNKKQSWPIKEWTSNIFEALIDTGHKEGYKVYCKTGNSRDGSEWLYDLTWLDYNTETKELKKCALALESEWNMKESDIIDDFSKLLLVRADYKMFVFQQKNIKGFEDYINKFRKLIQSYKDNKGDSYIISCTISDEEDKFKHEILEAV